MRTIAREVCYSYSSRTGSEGWESKEFSIAVISGLRQSIPNYPLLRLGKDGANGQKLDSVYLDTTYLNPKYAFPNQKGVIKACEGLCVGLNG